MHHQIGKFKNWTCSLDEWRAIAEDLSHFCPHSLKILSIHSKRIIAGSDKANLTAAKFAPKHSIIDKISWNFGKFYKHMLTSRHTHEKSPQKFSQPWALVLPQWTPFYTWMPEARNPQNFHYKPGSTIHYSMNFIQHGANFFRNKWALRPCPWKQIEALSLAFKRQKWRIFRGEIEKTRTKWIPDDSRGLE